MKKRIYLLTACTLISALLLMACGSKSSDASESYTGSAAYEDSYERAYADEPAMEEAATDDYYESDDIYETGNGLVTDDPEGNRDVESNSSSRKLVKTVNMTLETEEFDALIENVKNKIDTLGGYAESMNISGRSQGSYDTRTAYITARIPADKLVNFTESVSENSNVLSKNESAEDVTLNYVDMQSKVSSLKTEQERLNELIAEAEDIETLVALEERLAQVRYEIESYESRLRVMDNQVTYSTVYLDIREVTTYTPTVTHEKTLGERMSEAFNDSLVNISEFFQDLAVAIVGSIPALLILAVVVAIILLIVKLAGRASKKKKGKAIARTEIKTDIKNADQKKEQVKDAGGNFDPMTGEPIAKDNKK
ncbi:MAG: DUF4349 domain-containing protein [Lachnospiraceae bacterium]|nr:DUF4349 domain-containing protein [Lachnospiraceae bacterium]